MSQENLPITVAGKKELDDELQRLLQEDRPQVIKAIEEARSHGDLSENAEYDAAKERQALIEGRINDIRAKIASADVIDPSRIQSDRIVFGAHVQIEEAESGEELQYQIVGVDEADVKKGKISVLSPVARALIGKSEGDVITVRSPKGEKEYEILSFEYK